jgi:hypothetical protein
MGHPLWREVGSVVFHFCFNWHLQGRAGSVMSPTGLMSTFYWFYFWDSPNLEGHVPGFICPRNRVAQLYPWALGYIRFEVEVTLRLTVSQSVCLGIEHPCETCDLILLSVEILLSEICSFVSVGRPFWREDGSAIFSVITQWSEARRTRNHTLLSHLRLPQPGGPGSRIYIPQELGGPVFPPGSKSKSKSHYNWLPINHYVKVSSPFWDLWPDFAFCPKVVFWNLLSCLCGAPSLTRGQVCHLSFSVYSNLPVFTSSIYVTCVSQFRDLYTTYIKLHSIPSR